MNGSTNIPLQGLQGLLTSESAPLAEEEDLPPQLAPILGVQPPKIVIGAILSLLVLATVIGNVLVFVAVSLRKNLRTVSNMFIMSLSVADFLVGTVVMIPAMLNEIFDEWLFSKTFCSIWASFDVMLCSASILNVCLISLDRYLVIMRPLRYNTIMTNRRAIILLLMCWCLSIISSFVPIETGYHNPDVPSLENLTLYSQRPKCLFIVGMPFALSVSMVTIFLPIVVAFVLYYRVSKEAKRQSCILGTLIAPTNVLLGQKVASKHIREPFTRKATVTLGIIVGAYVATWAPFLIFNIVEAVCGCIHPKLFSATVWLGYCNSLVNPIIYPLFMRDFRRVYMEGLTICCPFIKTLKRAKTKTTDYIVMQRSVSR